MDSDQAFEAAIAEMEKCVRCLGLELPGAVHVDVRRIWDNLKQRIAALAGAGGGKDRQPWLAPAVPAVAGDAGEKVCKMAAKVILTGEIICAEDGEDCTGIEGACDDDK